MTSKITEANKRKINDTLSRAIRHVVDSVPPPDELTPREFLRHQIPVELLRHLKWINDSGLLRPDQYAGKNKKIVVEADDERYVMRLNWHTPEIQEIKAMQILEEYEFSSSLSLVQPTHPYWQALVEWRRECKRMAVTYTALRSRIDNNMIYINTAGQLKRCYPALVPLLDARRESVVRTARMTSPCPSFLTSKIGEMSVDDRAVQDLLARYHLVRNVSARYWIYG